MDKIIIWISGCPGDGKTTISKELCSPNAGFGPLINTFRTDHFICDIDLWCDEGLLLDKWQMYGNRRIGEFIDWCVSWRWGDYIAERLYQAIIMACNNEDILVVEGYMHYDIQCAVMRLLEQTNYRVWISLRENTFTKVSNGLNWRKQ
jgi:hypothetical protein